MHSNKNILIAKILWLLSFALSAPGYSQAEADLYFHAESSNPYSFIHFPPNDPNSLAEQRDYNKELKRLYGTIDPDSHFKFCSTGGFGCNYLTKSSNNDMRAELVGKKDKDIEDAKKRIERVKSDVAADIGRMRNGQKPQTNTVKKELAGRVTSPKIKNARAAKGRLENSTNNAKAGAAKLKNTQEGMNSSAPDLGNAQAEGLSDFSSSNPTDDATAGYGFNGTAGYSDTDADVNTATMNDKANFYQSQGNHGMAESMRGMADRYQTFMSGGRPQGQPASPDILAEFGIVAGDLDYGKFTGYETGYLANQMNQFRESILNQSLFSFYTKTLFKHLAEAHKDSRLGDFFYYAEKSYSFYHVISTSPDAKVGLFIGAGIAVRDTVKGTWAFYADPAGAIGAAINSLLNLGETWDIIQGIINENFQLFLNCENDPAACGEMTGKLSVEIGPLIGTGGVASGKLLTKISRFISLQGRKLATAVFKKGRQLNISNADLQRLINYSDFQCSPGSISCGGNYGVMDDVLDFTIDVQPDNPARFIQDLIDTAKTVGLNNSDNLSKALSGDLPVSKLRIVSNAAFNAAENTGEWIPKNKHTLSGGGSRARFDTDDFDEIRDLVRDGLRSNRSTFMMNPNLDGTFRIIADAGKVIGVRGQTKIRIIVGEDGKVINAFPVNVK